MALRRLSIDSYVELMVSAEARARRFDGHAGMRWLGDSAWLYFRNLPVARLTCATDEDGVEKVVVVARYLDDDGHIVTFTEDLGCLDQDFRDAKLRPEEGEAGGLESRATRWLADALIELADGRALPLVPFDANRIECAGSGGHR